MKRIVFAVAIAFAACNSSSTTDGGVDQTIAADQSIPPDQTSIPDLSGDAGGPAASCVASGGTVGETLCCGAAADFPDTCAIGACGCSPMNSHMVKTCGCPTGKCFDGATCK